MSDPQTAEQFFHLLKRSGLLPPEEVDGLPFRYQLRDIPTGKEIAKALIRHQVLTVFQARRILHGSSRGLRLGDYRVLDLLGSGGMGFIYLAEEVNSKWKVAIKVLSSRYRLNSGMRARFGMEAEAGQKLRHSHIVRTEEFCKAEDIYGELWYIVMEYVRGVSLFELVRQHARQQTQLPWRQACDIIRQAAIALQHAHQEDMIHRDVKPENILIRSDGGAKLLDFGLAMLDEQNKGSADKNCGELVMAMVEGQNCLGTADYVAPEQIKDSFEVNHRADIYSLGCTMYFALAGRVPFPAKGQTKAELTYMKLKCHRKMKPKPLGVLRADVPPKVIAIVEAMMKKLPERRIATAARVAELLKPFCQRQPVEFDWEDVLKRRWKEAEKRRRVLEASYMQSALKKRQAATGRSSTRDFTAPSSPADKDAAAKRDLGPPDSTERSPQVMRETRVRDDTQVPKGRKPQVPSESPETHPDDRLVQ